MNGEDVQKLVFNFLKNKDVVSVAIQGEKGSWVSNFYYILDEDFNFYFITNIKNYFSESIQENPNISFTVFWRDEKNKLNRESVQGSGKVQILEDGLKSKEVFLKFGEKFPEINSILFDENNFLNKKYDDFVFFKLEPEFVKYINDEKFHDFESVSLKFKNN